MQNQSDDAYNSVYMTPDPKNVKYEFAGQRTKKMASLNHIFLEQRYDDINQFAWYKCITLLLIIDLKQDQ